MSSTDLGQQETTASQEISFWRFSAADRSPLRIGLLLDSPKLARFFTQIIDDIQASNFAKIELLVYRKAPKPVSDGPQNRPRSGFGRLLDAKTRKRVLYDFYLRLDKRMKPANHPLETIDCSDRLAGIESIEVEPIGKKFVQRFPEDALEKIRSKDLDVLLRFGFNILHGDILKAARYGVWSYHHGDNDFYRGGPAHFWELHEGAASGTVTCREPTRHQVLRLTPEESRPKARRFRGVPRNVRDRRDRNRCRHGGRTRLRSGQLSECRRAEC